MATPTSTAFIRRLHKITTTSSLLKTLSATTCCICSDDFLCQEDLLRLPSCRHIFHRQCTLPWLARKNTCPLCRSVLPPEPFKLVSVSLPVGRLCYRPESSLPPGIHTLVTELFSGRRRIPELCTDIQQLNFHLKPESILEVDPPSSSLPESQMNDLQKLLFASGYVDKKLLSRACGPFWFSGPPEQPPPPAASSGHDQSVS